MKNKFQDLYNIFISPIIVILMVLITLDFIKTTTLCKTSINSVGYIILL